VSSPSTSNCTFFVSQCTMISTGLRQCHLQQTEHLFCMQHFTWISIIYPEFRSSILVDVCFSVKILMCWCTFQTSDFNYLTAVKSNITHQFVRQNRIIENFSFTDQLKIQYYNRIFLGLYLLTNGTRKEKQTCCYPVINKRVQKYNRILNYHITWH
jgi:hypothetical protein